MIRVQNLTKYYDERLAVDNISFNIGKVGNLRHHQHLDESIVLNSNTSVHPPARDVHQLGK